MPSANFTSIFDLLSGLVALLVSYYAFKNNRIVGNNLLRYIGFGFLLLALSLFLSAGTATLARMTPVDAVKVRGIELVAYLVDTTLEFAAYLVFAWGYVLSSLRRPETSSEPPSPAGKSAGAVPVLATLKSVALATFIFTVYVISQLAIVILLLFIVYHGVAIFRRGKSNVALTVLFGFALLFVAHLAFFTAALYTSGALLIVGDAVQFCGFIALLFFLFWSDRIVK